MKNKKFIIISLVLFFVLLGGLFVYYQSVQKNLITLKEENEINAIETEIIAIIDNFYQEYEIAINTNITWVDFIEKYTSGQAKEILTHRAAFFLNEANQGRQRLIQIISPITIRFYEVTPTRIQILVDFNFEERIVGGNLQNYVNEKLLILEKIESKWMIVEDLDRTDNFNEWANKQNFPTAQISY